nr:uncharacterized protein [Tanacetum cinerariifolium]
DVEVVIGYRMEREIRNVVKSDRKRTYAYCSWQTGIKRFCCPMVATAQLSYRFNANQLDVSHQVPKIKRSSLQVKRHTQKNQEQSTHNLYEDDHRLDKKEYEKSEKMRLLEFRLNSYHKFCQMVEPKWLIKYFDKLGISLNEKYQLANVATDDVLDTVSIATTYRRFVEYLEECIVPSYDMNQLDAAIVELHCNEEAEIKYLTVHNWYAVVEETATVRRHTQKNQEQPTHNLYEDDQRLDEKEYEKSGISLNEKYQLANVATDAVFDTVSIAMTH